MTNLSAKHAYYSYTLVNAFTSSPTSGNPAALIVLPSSTSHVASIAGPDNVATLKALYPPLPQLVRAAKELDQPMTAFAIPLSSHIVPGDANADADAHTAVGTFTLRWINPIGEVQLCGHASMALSWSLLSAHPEWEGVEYHTVSHGKVTARRTKGDEGTVRVSLDFPELVERTTVEPRSERWTEVMRLIEMATGGKAGGWEESMVLALVDAPGRILVELNQDASLEAMQLESVRLAPIQPANLIFTQILARSSKEEHIRSRVFNTTPGFEHEDSVTGSAHCLIIPYLLSDPAASTRLRRTLHSPTAEVNANGNALIRVHQVSPRGGRMIASWREAEGTVRLEGTCVRVGEGSVMV